MALILQIDTATEHASICLSKNGQSELSKISNDQKNHGSFLQPAIQEILSEYGIKIDQIDAVAVSNGPGSYTGLRVGLASAKGISYALQKPLILINTLQIIAISSINREEHSTDSNILIPMIDARRMEVFTACYNQKLEEITAPEAKILDENSFQSVLDKNKIVFCGNGSVKFQNVCHHQNAQFSNVQHSAADMSILAFNALVEKKFADLAYCEPFYVKSFYTMPSKK